MSLEGTDYFKLAAAIEAETSEMFSCSVCGSIVAVYVKSLMNPTKKDFAKNVPDNPEATKKPPTAG